MNSYVWNVSDSPYKSEFLNETIEFGSENPVFLIDQLGGKRPALFNSEFLTKGKINISMYPSSLLDSNVLDLLDRFVHKGKATDGFREFLKFLVQKGWDSSAMFYYLEHFSKSSLEDFRKNAVRRTESLLKIHSMDEPHFLRTGEVTPNEEAVRYYTSNSGVSNLYEVAEKRVDSFINSYSKSNLTSMIEATEIALIKMVLIRKSEMKNSSPVEQYNEFIRFLKQDLGIMLAREAHLALHYFCDNAGRLLGIQSNTPKEKAISIIKSTAWDIYLLRMPEVLFSESCHDVCIAYVSTQEKQLQALARLFTIEQIESFDSANIMPVVSFSMVGIPRSIQTEIKDELLPANNSLKKVVPLGLNQALFKQLELFCA